MHADYNGCVVLGTWPTVFYYWNVSNVGSNPSLGTEARSVYCLRSSVSYVSVLRPKAHSGLEHATGCNPHSSPHILN
jgi:hypothetical protein